MSRDIGYLKEDSHHKWYQIIYVDKDDVLHIGINLNDYMIIGGIDIPLK